MSDFYGKKQNIFLISCIIFLLLDKKEVCLWWIIIMGIMGNVRRLSYRNNISYFFRMTIYFAVYFIPFYVTEIQIELGLKYTNSILKALVVVFVVAFLIVWLEKKKYYIFFSDYAIAMLEYKSKYRIFLSVYNLIGAAIFEEFFFRGYIIAAFNSDTLKIGVSTVYFSLSHYLVPWSDGFKKKDYIKQIFIGGINALLYIYAQSIIPCIILHLICNFSSIWLELKRYKRFFLKKRMYDRLLQENIEELLPKI